MDSNPLSFKYKSRELNSFAKERRLVNIEAFSELDRKPPLKFGEIERFLLFFTSDAGEEVYIKYPGKESAREKNRRPLDFRPAIKFPDGTWLKNLSFGDIWDDITDLHSQDQQTLSELAALFFRMAYMVDTVMVEEILPYVDVDIATDTIINNGTLTFRHYAPTFSREIMNHLSKKIGSVRGISLEAYLIYNDLLVQNEDCKYFYRNQTETPDKEWNYKNGRLNTLLSHISVIEYLQGKITFSEITMRFQRGMGVAPVTNADEITDITNGLIVKENNNAK